MVSEPRSPLQNTVNCELTFEGDTVCQYHRVEEEHRVCVLVVHIPVCSQPT